MRRLSPAAERVASGTTLVGCFRRTKGRSRRLQLTDATLTPSPADRLRIKKLQSSPLRATKGKVRLLVVARGIGTLWNDG